MIHVRGSYGPMSAVYVIVSCLVICDLNEVHEMHVQTHNNSTCIRTLYLCMH